MNSLRALLLCILVILSVLGIYRQQFSGDIFDLLPSDLDVVEALKTHRENFSQSQELLIAFEADTAIQAAQAAQSLARQLKQLDVVSSVIWQEPQSDESNFEMEMLAYRWLNAPNDEVESLADRFSEERLSSYLAAQVTEASASSDPFAMAMLLGDPMGLLSIDSPDPAISERAFVESADGRFRVIYVRPTTSAEGEWLETVKSAVGIWNGAHATLSVQYAGNPEFFSEFSKTLSGDLLISVLATGFFVALLFWIAHRRFRPLLWMLALLTLVLVSTVSVGGLLLGTLNVISLGYAAVLMGLAADYGLLLYQERKSTGASVVTVTKNAAPSIAWAALTTAGAFLCISLGSLPGMKQLGVLVALGVLLAAVVMIALYLAPLASTNHKSTSADGGKPARRLDTSSIHPTVSIGLTLVILTLSVALLIVRPPHIDSSPNTLGPAQTRSFVAMNEIREQLGQDHSPYFLMFEATDAAAVSEAFRAVEPLLAQAEQEKVIDSWQLPTALWPKPDSQQANLETIAKIASSKQRFVTETNAVGLDAESQELTLTILSYFADMANQEVPITPQSELASWVVEQAISLEGDRYIALGALTPSSTASAADMIDLQSQLKSIPTVTLAGWPLASPALLGTMKSDSLRIAIPMGILLLLVLFLAFRGLIEIGLCLLGLCLTLFAVAASVSMLGWTFNLMNILALPLLLGITVDYSIHIQMGLQRHRGDTAAVQATVGRAILLAAATTAIAFASLTFASNEGLASLGKVSAIGVVVAALFSVYLLPACWRFFRKP